MEDPPPQTATQEPTVSSKWKDDDLIKLDNSLTMEVIRSVAQVVNSTMQRLIQVSKVGVKIVDICNTGDVLILKSVSDLFSSTRDENGKRFRSGIGFPTCVSVNGTVCHFSPASKDDETTLKAGDLVKIDLGAHINGYVLGAAHTLALPSEDDAVNSENKKLIHAAWEAASLAARMFRPGVNSWDITSAVQAVAKARSTTVVDSLYCHNTTQYNYTGSKSIYNVPGEGRSREKFDIVKNSIWCVDIAMANGDGKGRPSLTDKTTIFGYTGSPFQVKMQISKAVMKEVVNNFQDFPFPLRMIKSPNSRSGLSEGMTQGAIESHPVISLKKGQSCAQFKFYIMVNEKGAQLLSGTSDTPEGFEFTESIGKEYRDYIIRSLKKKKKKKKKKTT